MGAGVTGTPVAAQGMLFVNTARALYALKAS
jgi:hypothetical protein